MPRNPAPPEIDQPTRTVDESDRQLAQLGYQRWTRRRLNKFANMAISMTIISTPTGIFSLYGSSLNSAGPGIAFWGWAVVWLCTLLVGAAMAEIAATMATSGAMYYWASDKGLGNRWLSWVTAHLNLLGLIAASAAVDYGAAVFASALLNMQYSYNPTPAKTFFIFTGILAVHALLNVFANLALPILNKISVWWITGGVVTITAVLLLVPSHHQSLSFALGHVANGTGFTWLPYAMALSLGMGLYTFCGFDASIHVSEETQNASSNAPSGIVRSIFYSGLAGIVLLFGMNLAIQHYTAEVGSSNVPAQILLDALGATGAKLMLAIVLGCMLFCGLAAVTAASRQCFAVSRDRVLPGSAKWRKVHEASGVPRNAVWFTVALSFVLTLPAYWNTTIFNAIASVNVVGVFSAYGIPIALRLKRGRGFVPDAGWNLKGWGTKISVAAVVWVVLLDVLVCVPSATPITVDSFNYTPVALGIVLILSQIWWFVSARRTFTGPVSDVTSDYLAQFSELV
ncbi:MAG TPA: amino acid permease [Actinocrinis sp.]|nr:amino acid permease [Actinocrinis sp.]